MPKQSVEAPMRLRRCIGRRHTGTVQLPTVFQFDQTCTPKRKCYVQFGRQLAPAMSHHMVRFAQCLIVLLFGMCLASLLYSVGCAVCVVPLSPKLWAFQLNDFLPDLCGGTPMAGRVKRLQLCIR